MRGLFSFAVLTSCMALSQTFAIAQGTVDVEVVRYKVCK
jgi:hypothetical protein